MLSACPWGGGVNTRRLTWVCPPHIQHMSIKLTSCVCRWHGLQWWWSVGLLWQWEGLKDQPRGDGVTARCCRKPKQDKHKCCSDQKRWLIFIGLCFRLGVYITGSSINAINIKFKDQKAPYYYYGQQGNTTRLCYQEEIFWHESLAAKGLLMPMGNFPWHGVNLCHRNFYSHVFMLKH